MSELSAKIEGAEKKEERKEEKAHEKPAEKHADKVEKIIKNADRIEKIKDWFKNPYNSLLIGILVLAFAIRLYFFVKTNGQTLWYDEADYMATAKHWAFNVPYNLNIHRPPLFMLLGALGFMMGLSENALRFILVLLPSTALVYAIYLLGKEMYDEKVGLIASFLTAMSWTLLFWTNRFQPDYFSMFFQVLAIFFMWRYWKTEKTKPIVWAGIFSALGLMFKVSALLVPMAFIVFIFCKERFSAIKNKNYYWFSLAFLLTLVPYFAWAYSAFKNPLAFSVGYGVAGTLPIGWHVLGFLYTLSENVLFALFVIGALLALKFLLYADILIKEKNKCFDPGLFSMIVLAIVAAFFVFWIRNAEDRWVFLWLPFIFILIGNALMFIYNFGKKYSKILSVIVIIGLLAWGGYMQFSHGKTITEAKIDSYLPVKEAALWMKDNSLKSDKIFTFSYPQTAYYSERDVLTSNDMEGVDDAKKFEEFVQREKPKYIELSIFENHPAWLYKWPQEYNDTIMPVQVYFVDETKKQPALIVYELNSEQKADNLLDVLNKQKPTESNTNKTAENNATALNATESTIGMNKTTSMNNTG